MAIKPAAAIDRLTKSNGNRYNVGSNPFGLAVGGHRQNYPQTLNDTASVAEYIAATAGEVDTDAAQTADDRRQTGADRAETTRVAGEAAKFDPALYAPRDSVAITNANDAPLGRWSHFAGTEAQAAAAGFPALGGAGDTFRHWNVFTYGVPTRQAQILSETFGVGTTPGRLFTRSKHDADWRPYRENFSTAGGSLLGRLDAFAGAADRAGTNVNQRGSAPTAPANGDLWGLATGLWTFFGGIVRQVYDTTSLPAPTNPEIDAGTNTLRKAWSVLDVWRAAVAADQEVLIGSWNAADLNGLGQILLDLPTGYSGFILRERNLRVASGTAGLILRIGPTAGGAVDSGSADYNNVAATATTGWANSRQDADVAFIRQISTGPGQSDVNFTSGADSSWSFRVFSSVFNAANSFDLRSGSRNTAAYLVRRLQIGFNAPLAASGSIRLYGIR